MKFIKILALFFVLILGNQLLAEELLSFDDFMLDKDSLIDKTIRIKGYCYTTDGDNYFLLKNGQTSDLMSQIPLDTKNLSRDVRKWLLQNCKTRIGSTGIIGQSVTIKATVTKTFIFELDVLEIEEIKNLQVNSSSSIDNLDSKSDELMSFDNFMLDKESLIDKTIRIKGYCYTTDGDNYFLLKNGQTSDFMSQIPLETKNLSRDVRKWLLHNCKTRIGSTGIIGQLITIKATVTKTFIFELNVIEIEELKNIFQENVVLNDTQKSNYSSFKENTISNNQKENNTYQVQNQIKYTTKQITGYISAKSGINIRQEPTTKSQKVGSLAFNKEVTILDPNGPKQTIEGVTSNWFKITDGVITGWCFGGFVSLSKNE